MGNLLEQLKALKETAPDARFTARSRQTILSAPNRSSVNRFYFYQARRRLFEGLSFSIAVGLAALLIYLSISFINQNTQTKLAENEPRPDFNISLEKAEYYKEIAPNIYVVVLGNKK
jgi:hypothetical protein